MRIEARTPRRLSLLVLSLAAAASCTDEEVVFRDRELFPELPGASASFIGYSDQTTKLTVCGNCHIEKQGDWSRTAHANAWDGLQASGASQVVCEGCHTVGQLGNLTAEPGGHETTGDSRYWDVQCESCHGPGLAHVSNPTDRTVPLAPLTVGVGFTTGCGECHEDTHHPFVEEWAQSRHGDAANSPATRTRAGCTGCHNGEDALAAWGINTEFVEKGQGQSIGITCAVCHDPHSAANPKQLRFPIDVQDVEANLCMKCHQKRALPDEGTSSRGPHSPQGPLLLGEFGTVGWTPPNLSYDQARIRGTHGTERNERLCAGCHLNSFEVTDAATGELVFNATGHLFKPIPCLDEQGVPTGNDDCALTTEARSFQSCTTSGCHGSAEAALSAMVVAQTRIANLVEELNGLLDRVPADQFSATDDVFTTAEGARFNAQLGAIESSAIHNPFLTEALLTATIAQVKLEYGLTSLSNVTLENVIGTPALPSR